MMRDCCEHEKMFLGPKTRSYQIKTSFRNIQFINLTYLAHDSHRVFVRKECTLNNVSKTGNFYLKNKIFHY